MRAISVTLYRYIRRKATISAGELEKHGQRFPPSITNEFSGRVSPIILIIVFVQNEVPVYPYIFFVHDEIFCSTYRDVFLEPRYEQNMCTTVALGL